MWPSIASNSNNIEDLELKYNFSSYDVISVKFLRDEIYTKILKCVFFQQWIFKSSLVGYNICIISFLLYLLTKLFFLQKRVHEWMRRTQVCLFFSFNKIVPTSGFVRVRLNQFFCLKVWKCQFKCLKKIFDIKNLRFFLDKILNVSLLFQNINLVTKNKVSWYLLMLEQMLKIFWVSYSIVFFFLLYYYFCLVLSRLYTSWL